MRKKLFAWVMAFAMLLSLLPATGLTALAAGEAGGRVLDYGDYTFTKISNPTTKSGEADGLNTNDETGYGANRLNSYAWAMAERGDYIYIGTNRALLASSVNSIATTLDWTQEKYAKVVDAIDYLTDSDIPMKGLVETDYIPQIIRFDVKTGQTKVIYQPKTVVGQNGKLYYEGSKLPVTAETASFRSVSELNGNLYFGSMGMTTLRVVRIDENDDCSVVYSANAVKSSLRASCIYDAGDGETIYFGGQDAEYAPYLEDKQSDPTLLPIVIRYLDPTTAGTEQENWSGLIADYRDFSEYAHAKVYSNAGGTVWDLCSYNGYLYLILAYDDGWAMFRGEKGGNNPNDSGWTWTEVVGNNGTYPLAMNEDVGTLNRDIAEECECLDYDPILQMLHSKGTLESTATPYVYNGKMYIGTFDNSTSVTSEMARKLLIKMERLTNLDEEDPDYGPTLTQIFRPCYEALTHPQHLWVMDENETITPVDDANELLEGTTNEYVWRMIQSDGKLYVGTYDASTQYDPILNISFEKLLDLASEEDASTVEEFQENLEEKSAVFTQASAQSKGLLSTGEATPKDELLSAAAEAYSVLVDLFEGNAGPEDLLPAVTNLREAKEAYENVDENALLTMNSEDQTISSEMSDDIDWVLESTDDPEGLQYWTGAKDIVNETLESGNGGFDLFVTENGKDWTGILSNGLCDMYNYGARTFVEHDGDLYLGTANPYYGAQLWKVTENDTPTPTPTPTPSGGGGGGGGGVSTYQVSTATPENGTIKLDKTNAAKGNTVTITVTPNEGYTVDTVTVKDANGNVIETTKTSDTTYTFTMPNSKVTVSATFKAEKEAEDTTPVTQPTTLSFTDVKSGDWFHDSVSYVYEKSLMNGVTNTEFSPNDTTTRAMVVTILWRMAGSPVVDYAMSFSDVPEGQWYTEAVRWACSTGVVKGISDTEFGPDVAVTREALATMVYRYEQSLGNGFTGTWVFLLPQSDANQVSEWADEAMHWCVMKGIINGDDQNNLNPQKNATRAEIATIFKNLDSQES